MVDRTAFFSCRMGLGTKQKLKQKAEELGVDMTELIKKIAEEEIVFLDKNLKRLFNTMKLEVKNGCSADSNTKFKYLRE